MDLDTPSSKREKKRNKEKRRKKKRTVERDICFTQPTWLNEADSLKGKEEKKKKKRNCFLNLIIICLVVTY